MISDEELLAKLKQHPALKKRMEELLYIVENPAGETDLGDVAEERIVDSLKDLGNELFQEWIEVRSKSTAVLVEKTMSMAHKNIKKKPTGGRLSEK